VTWTFNPAQLATWAEAEDLAKKIDDYRASSGLKLGGGVMPVTKDPDTSGIYVPQWSGGPAGFPEPSDEAHGKYWLHYRFFNGRSGINVGLILDLANRYGGNWQYVFYTLNSSDLS
jgi:hypothetical protein